MAQLSLDSSFQRWELTDREYILGSVLTTSQKQVIQNQLVQLAEEKINLEQDPLNPLKHIQKEAYLRGQIDALKYLLTLSSSSENLVMKNQLPQE